jgi:hypothetical protein
VAPEDDLILVVVIAVAGSDVRGLLTRKGVIRKLTWQHM